MSGNLYLEITNACTYGCRTCPHGTGNPRRGRYFIPVEKMNGIVDRAIREKNIGSVTLSGGEPLTHPDFPEIVHQLVSRKLNVTVLTNLYLLNERDIVGAVRGDLPHMSFVTALHSASAEEHDGIINCKGGFERTLAGIDTLVRHHARITIKCILCHRTAEQLPEMFARFTGRWGSAIRFDLCGMDLCGADQDTLNTVLIDFRHESVFLQKMLDAAEAFYGDRTAGMVMITEYPMCWVDPYYWKLVRTANHERMLAFVKRDDMDLVDSLDRISTCSPCAEACRNCAVNRICPGIWPSVYRKYGDGVLRPIRDPSAEAQSGPCR